MTEWDALSRGSRFSTIRDYPSAPLIGDALWIERNNSTTCFYVWNGTKFIYDLMSWHAPWSDS